MEFSGAAPPHTLISRATPSLQRISIARANRQETKSRARRLYHNFRNPDTQYRSGIDFHFDWGASHFLTKQLFVGVAGYAYQQITDQSGMPGSLPLALNLGGLCINAVSSRRGRGGLDQLFLTGRGSGR